MVSAACACLFGQPALYAQEHGSGPVPPAETATHTTKATIKLDADMVLATVTVTDPLGRLVTGLDEGNFRVFEDGKEQEILHFSSEDVPVSIGVIFDVSGSMADKIDKSRSAAMQFFSTSNPQDEFLLVNFSDRAQLMTPFTEKIDTLQSALLLSTGKGSTAMLDALYLGLSELKGGHNTRKALLIISDGGDNHSRYSEADIRRFLKESDVQMYAIGIYGAFGCPTEEECHGPELLRDLTEMSGGRAFDVKSLDELPDIANKISMELRNQYVLGYRPTNRDRDGKWRKIKIRLRTPKGLPPLNVTARFGYYAPSH
jgi:Ca-activated chloride channel homolog